MTPAEQLDKLGQILATAQQRWHEFIYPPEAPDGLPTSSSASDHPKVAGGDTSDPTPTAAFQRPYIPEKEARNKLIDIATAIVTMWSLTPHVVERDLPEPATLAMRPSERLISFAHIGTVSLGRAWGTIDRKYLPYCKAELASTLTWAMQLEGLMGPRVAPLDKATWQKDELCHGNKGTPYACNHDHEKSPVPAVKDGLCTAGYHRRYRAEKKGEAA
jgi:hypothetical protein